MHHDYYCSTRKKNLTPFQDSTTRATRSPAPTPTLFVADPNDGFTAPEIVNVNRAPEQIVPQASDNAEPSTIILHQTQSPAPNNVSAWIEHAKFESTTDILLSTTKMSSTVITNTEQFTNNNNVTTSTSSNIKLATSLITFKPTLSSTTDSLVMI